MSELDGAVPQASPAPISSRTTANCQMPPINPVHAVITLQKASPAAMMLRRLARSASQAIGMPSNE